MKRQPLILAALLVAGTAGLVAAAETPPIPAYISAAVADGTRPEADRKRDDLRRPAEVLAFAGVKPGDRVGELMPGRGYFTAIFCRIVGARGHVFALELLPAVVPVGAPPREPMVPPCPNVSTDRYKIGEFSLPAGLDLVWTSENYHDLHNAMFGGPDMAAFNRVIFNALKPGGIFLVEDHAAAEGSGTRDTDTLHRIDPAAVIREATSVGFEFAGESTVLRNPDDPHTAKVFDLGGHSDKFLLKFRRPLQ